MKCICVFLLFPEVHKFNVFRDCALCKTVSSQWSVFETVYRVGYRYNGQNCILVASTPESYAIILASLNGAKCPPFWCYGNGHPSYRVCHFRVTFYKTLYHNIQQPTVQYTD